MVLPQPRRRLEDVVAEQAPPVTSHEPDRLDDVVGDDVGDEVVEVDAYPAGLDALAAAPDLALELVGALEVDAEQVVAVGAGARAAAAGLDAEEVVEDGDDEVVVQVALALAADDERHDRQSLGVEVAEDLDAGLVPPGRDGALEEVVLPRGSSACRPPA